MANSFNHLLDELDRLKNRFGSGKLSNLETTLVRTSRQKIRDVPDLIRYHEILLFLSAYPQSASLQKLSEAQLRSFDQRISSLRDAEVDLSVFDDPEVSGVAGTAVVDTFTYYIVRWLLNKHPSQIRFDWDWFDDSNRLAETWPRFMPLLDEDGFVEANVPYPEWLRAAKGRTRALPWLLQQFAGLPKPEREIAELYDSQNLFVSWNPGYRATRTGMRLPVSAGNIFYHRKPLIQRREVSLRDELRKPAPAFERLSAKQGEAILDMAREASTVRYRELYGFTHGDPTRVLRARVGRGVEIFVMGLPPVKRLPLRAYHAALIFKNGVPVGYFEGLSLFERMESGFNLYYTFREGETAWLYARVLNIFHHLLGVSVFTLDPYQIGFENEEGIESGAFWFYRKFGFRSTSPALMKLTSQEEKKIATRTKYRTSANTLRKLAESSMVFELETENQGDWDRFSVRKLGIAVQRQMAKRGGNAQNFLAAEVKELTRLLRVEIDDWPRTSLGAFTDFAAALSLASVRGWSETERSALIKLIRAKSGANESSYLRLMQKHSRLRKALIQLGSGQRSSFA